jgi:hypothetical protein
MTRVRMGATFGKLVLAPTLGGVGQQAVPHLPGVGGVTTAKHQVARHLQPSDV